MLQLLDEREIYLRTYEDLNAVESMKNNICYVALDYKAELSKYSKSNENDVPYTLPDGNVIHLKEERFKCPEILFQPEFLDLGYNSLQETVINTVNKCHPDHQEYLYKNIILTGGTTLFNGFSERLQKEVFNRCPLRCPVNISAPRERGHSVWLGGSIIATLSAFRKNWITKEEYLNIGAAVANAKHL